MIVELAVVGSVAVVSSLALTARIVRLSLEAERDLVPKPRLTKEAIAEKRRVLERDRAEWARMLGKASDYGATGMIAKIDASLLALADEDRE